MSAEKMDLNQATEDELSVLPGIGQKLATKIVAYRQEQGAFTAVEDLSAVPGISDRMVGNLLERLTVGDTGPEDETSAVEDEVDQPEMEVLPGDDESSEDKIAEDEEPTPEAKDKAKTGPGTIIAV